MKEVEKFLLGMTDRMVRRTATGTGGDGREVYCFSRWLDAIRFSFRGWLRGHSFIWTEEIEELPGKRTRKWHVLTPEDLPEVGSGQGSMRGPRRR